MRALPAPVLRASHAPDRVELTGSSFSYKGRITKSRDNGTTLKRVVDGAVSVTTVSERERMKVQLTLERVKSHAYRNMGMGAAGAVTGAALWAIPGIGPIAGSLLTVSSSTVSAWSFLRANDASTELEKWQDPIAKILSQRTTHSHDFNALQNVGLKGLIFTNEEIQHIWHRTITHQSKEFLECLASGDFKKIERFLRLFIENKSPLTPKAISYAFHDNEVITNPKKSASGYWTREDIESISGRFIKICGDYALFNSEVKREIQTVKNDFSEKKDLVDVGINAGRMAVELGADSIPLHFKIEKRGKMEKLENAWKKREIDGLEFEMRKLKIEEDFQKEPEVIRIESARRRKVLAVKTAGDAVHTALSHKADNQLKAIREKACAELVKKFKDPVAKILTDYNKTKKPT
jgi:hypothetical protein